MNPTAQLEQNEPQTPQPQASQTSCEEREALLDCPYGRRYIRRVDDDGKVVYDEVPLRLEDLLHPEEEDELVAVLGHSDDCGRLRKGLERLTPQNKTFAILEDVNVDLGLPGVKPIRPDVSVFEVATIPDGLRDMGTFYMNRHSAVPVLFIEVTSESTRPNDLVEKYTFYERANVQQYVLADRVHPSGAQVAGYEHRGDGFVQLQPDQSGRLWLPAFDLWIGFENGEAVLYDQDGVVPDSEELAEQLRDERLISQEHKQHAEDEKQRAEQERERAEQARIQVNTEKLRADSAENKMREMEAELARLKGR